MLKIFCPTKQWTFLKICSELYFSVLSWYNMCSELHSQLVCSESYILSLCNICHHFNKNWARSSHNNPIRAAPAIKTPTTIPKPSLKIILIPPPKIPFQQLRGNLATPQSICRFGDATYRAITASGEQWFISIEDHLPSPHQSNIFRLSKLTSFFSAFFCLPLLCHFSL